MDFAAYQSFTDSTAVYPKEIGLQYTVLGLCGEAGELANKLKKVYRDDGGKVTEARREELASELGDVLWYLTRIAVELGFDLGAVAHSNVLKLSKRKDQNTLHGSGDTR